MNTSKKAELTSLVRHIEIFPKSGIPIYNFKAPDTVGRNTRREKEEEHR